MTIDETGTVATVPTDAGPAEGHETKARTRSGSGHRIRGLAERHALLGLVAVVAVFFALNPSTRETFATSQNLAVLLGNQATVALLALAVVLPLVCGYFDFSLGAVAAASAVLTAGLMSFHDLPLGIAMTAGIGVGILVGLVNGLLVTVVGLNSFVTTLGMATLLGGLIQWYTSGQTILTGLDPRLAHFGSTTLLGVPQVVYVVAVIALALWYLLAQTPFGRGLYAIGANRRAATLVGIPVRRSSTLTFMLAGAVAGVVGVLALSRAGSATADSGTTLLFPALAAAFLGATSVRPGFFNIVGALVGVLFVSVAVSGLTLAGASSWASPVFNGAALLIAVALSHYLGRSRGLGSA
ncbi:ABC transporter permease [Cellulomonas sp. URHD0024]|uniref:ABC transporter permease n=1 Tax=Cellulomonas sp. URHD0024 TaxID=1302620 RepID=UPI00042A6808|nr:ABC transporter permease [Cellulomonas sp. URHD0024]